MPSSRGGTALSTDLRDVPVPWKDWPHAIGARDDTVEPLGSVMWFEESFLEDAIREAPACTWERDGDYVIQTERKPGDMKYPKRVWKLTGEWRLQHYGTPWCVWQMKAVWPD